MLKLVSHNKMMNSEQYVAKQKIKYNQMKLFKALMLLLVFTTTSLWSQVNIKTSTLELQISEVGVIEKLVDLKSAANYAAQETAYLINLKVKGEVIHPIKMKSKKDELTFSFDGGFEVKVKATNKMDYVCFEVVSVNKESAVQALLWGPYKTTISGIIGDFVGVVRNDDYAIGFQSLNIKTTGGELVNDEGAVMGRGTAAVPQDYGSSIQAFCINRTKPQEITAWNKINRTQVVAHPDFNLEGSAIALFGAPEKEALSIIEKIELGEGLPHMMIDGEWMKTSSKAGRPYIISNFGEETVDQMLDFTESVGFYSLYQSHPFKTWGSFDLIPSLFPNGRAGMKASVDKAKARDIKMGVHTLTNFITTNDPFVTPIPNKGLAVFAQTTITSDIDENSDEIFIENPADYESKNTLQTVRIGDELIRFSKVSTEAPYKLEDCKRGAFGTTVSLHKKGATIARLIDYPYKTFFPDMNLQNEMIDNLVDFFNETGVNHLDFDGHEGTYATGFGDSAKDYFALRFMEGVKHPVINGTSRSGHFYWHINTYLNWGEPWYGGMKESQNNVRFNNQAVLERNYQPNMLGWFWYRSTSSIADMEWMLARAAGWNAGYALVVHPKDIDKNPLSDQVIQLIKVWEEAKNRKIFSDAQKKLLKAGENDFSLAKVNNDEFHLQYYKKKEFVHENIMLQPGQPNFTEWEFTNKFESQELYFQLGAEGEEGEIENIKIDIDGHQTIELPVTMKAGYSSIYNGSDTFLVYDEKGRLKAQEKIDFAHLKLDKGMHTFRVSCDYSEEDGIELKGVIRLKDKVDVIKL